jgi:glucose/mannose transport system substrate-binding protein
MIGQTLNNRYRITALVGEGAMGEVYRATDLQIGQEVAVKVITQKLAFDAEMLERFKREGEALRHLRHSNIVAFVDMFPLGKQQAIVMEYVPGGSLHSLIQRGPLPVDQATRIALELSDALARAHHLNIIHRDLKPENVLMAEDGTPKLNDFGVARLLSETARLTGTGTQVGTPYYMSPEAWEGKKLDAQADIWSLGVVLFEMLSGQLPFTGETLVAVMNKVLTTTPPELRKLRADVPPALVKIIQRMLTRDKAKRYQSMREVALDLERAAKAEGRAGEEAGKRKEAEGPKVKAGGTRSWPVMAAAAIIAGVLVVGGLIIAGGVGLWMLNHAGAANRSTPTALAAAMAPTLTVLPSHTLAVPTNTPRPTLTPSQTPPPPTPAVKVQLEVFSWWATGGEAIGLQKLMDQFKASHPNVEVINAAVASGAGSDAKAALRTRMLGGDPPDAFQVHMGHELLDTWVATGYMEPLDDVYSQYSLDKAFPQGVLDIVSYDGHPWSVPVNIHRANVLWYNKTVFKNAGLAAAPVTWAEFFAAAEQLKAKGITPLAFGDNGIWESVHLFETILIGSLGADRYKGLWTGDTRWNDPKVTDALNTFKKVLAYVNSDHAALSWDQANQLVIDGQAAMTIMGDWCDSDYAAKGFTDYGWAPVPGTKGIYDALSDTFGLPKNSKHPELTKEFLGVLGSKQGQETFNISKGSICARTDCDYSQFDAYLQSSAADWKVDAIVPSLMHGAAAKESWVTSIMDAMATFVTDRSVVLTQAELAQACRDAGVCK